MVALHRQLAKNEAGAAAIEYALITALIVLVIISAVGDVGEQVERLFDFVVDAFVQE